MNILIIYGTNSSGTGVVAETIAKRLITAGHTATVQHARDTTPKDLQRQVDLIILGSCTWERFTSEGARLEGQLQQHMFALTEAVQEPVKQKFALFGLGDSSYTNFCAAANHLEAAVQRWDGTTIVPTLRIDGYFFDLEKNRQRVDAWTDELVKKISS